MSIRVPLRLKLALLMTGVIAVLSLVVFVYLNVRMREDAMRAAHEEGLRNAELASFTVSPALLFEDRRSAREALTAVCRSSVVAAVDVQDQSGRRFTGCVGAGGTKHGVLVSTVPVTSENKVIGKLKLSLSLTPVANQVATSRRWLAGVTLLIFGVGMAAAVGISLVVTRPLQSITETAEAVRAGDLTRRTSATADDEVGTLGKTFNLMLDELEISRRELERLNRGLEQTVELRTREVTTLLQSTYDGIIAADANGRCVMVNRSAHAALGMDGGVFIGRDLHELLHGQCALTDCGLPSLLRGGQRRQERETFKKADGSSISVDVSVAPMQDGDRTTGTVMTFRDVTERDELQRQLDRAIRVSGLGTLAANMAHEFNNVLMGILPFIELIRRATNLEPRIEQWCKTIIQSVNRGKRVTQEVLRFTRPQPLNRCSLDVTPWLEEFTPSLQATAGKAIALAVVTDTPGLHISVDPEQFEQLLVNLVSNSRDAMPSGGVVAISMTRQAGVAHISVRDDGPGMSAETVRRAFEPFFSTKGVGGTGLGIPIAEQIVKAHGGTIELKSAPGHGTVFDIRLPLVTEAASGSNAPSNAPDTFKGRVLIVEDDATVAAGLKALLQHEGAEVAVVSNGQAALAALHETSADAIVLDIGLPDIDGVELYRLIASVHPDLPVVFSTGHGDESKIRDILVRPNVRFLLKPYPAEALLRALSEITTPRTGDGGRAPA